MKFSGVLALIGAHEVELAKAYGLAHRGRAIPNQVNTRSRSPASEGAYSVAVVSLIEEGLLELVTTARSALGPDLPLSMTA